MYCGIERLSYMYGTVIASNAVSRAAFNVDNIIMITADKTLPFKARQKGTTIEGYLDHSVCEEAVHL